MSKVNLRNSMIFRINEKDYEGPELQQQLNEELYEQKFDTIPNSSSSLGKYFYLEDENWKIDPLPTSKLDIQMRSSQDFDNLKQQLDQTKSVYFQTQSMSNFNFKKTFEQEQQNLNQKKPKKFYIPLTEEQKEQLRQKKLNKKIEEQRLIQKRYEEYKKMNLQRRSQNDLQNKQNQQKPVEKENLQSKNDKKKQLKNASLPNLSLTEQEILEYKKKIQEIKEQKSKEKQSKNTTQIKNEQDEEENIQNRNLNVKQEKQLIFEKINQFLVQLDELKQKSENIQSVKNLVEEIKKYTSTNLQALFLAYLFISQQIKYTNKELKEGKLSHDLNGDKILIAGQGTPIAKANLFNQVAQEIGKYMCQIAKGIIKSNAYVNGTKYKGNEQDSAWSIIEYQNQKFPVDVNLGGGYLKGSKFIEQFEFFYFFTEPLEFLYTHFPVNQKEFQLMPKSRQWNLEKFTDMPKYNPCYFQNNIQFFTHNTKNQINLNEDNFTIQIKSKGEQFAYRGVIKTKGTKPQELPLEQTNELIIEDLEKQIVNLNLKLPSYGQYSLSIQFIEITKKGGLKNLEATEKEEENQEKDNQNQQKEQNEKQEQLQNEEKNKSFYDVYDLNQNSNWEELVEIDINYNKGK
ncbi:hypothetical protein PPERSA_04326 [Pseudocohnilembus persalinus]|uniref:KY-like immunoglobulin-like domain-containing protein n=1 Tax=Pseudocohnilembus persalinus TaxID=266149 RepID=A0A0V0QQE9_PSEPJ|nr:hypothetical protein PPERSA_04326 [Pseudocohnilembus persalinus]|eukprot:KRX04511.1 hypothetical protein PPERSA_04326 [Pseudocohnilembus persalinus]